MIPSRVAFGRRSRARRLTQLRADVRDVAVDGMRAEDQAICDLRVGQARRDEPEDLQLAPAQFAVV
jgi:hypothetical protein